MFTSILDLKKSQYKDMVRPAYFLDLNLNQIIDRIHLIWGENVTSYYYYFPADKESEDYRRDIFADIKKEGMYEALLAFVEQMRARKEAAGKRESVQIKIQKAVWHLWEVGYYCDGLSALKQALDRAELCSDGMKAFYEYLTEYLDSDKFVQMQNTMDELRRQLLAYRITLTYENGQIAIAEGDVEGSYEAYLEKCFPKHPYELKTPFTSTLDLTNLEQELLQIFVKKNQEFFKNTEKFYKKYEKYADDVLVQFSAEICYYLSFRSFSLKMQEYGYEFTAPTVDETKDMAASGLYDLALACASIRDKKPVISNSFYYGADEKFFVLTGPNQGGKTTFARSLGQLIYFTKMGLDVPAQSANVHHFTDILTHFSVEESVETGRGKLKEELVRLAPMMDAHFDNAFVIINELFTTAANYDACIMGKSVLEHFIAQHCQGIYVTHLKELTEAHPCIVSLRATLDENRIQCFKIERSAADESACAINQVNKYRLTYEQLKERLS